MAKKNPSAKQRAAAIAGPIVDDAVKTALDAATTAAEAEADPVTAYEVTGNVLHNGVLYRLGTTIDLTADEAEPLLKSGHIVVVPADPPAHIGEK